MNIKKIVKKGLCAVLAVTMAMSFAACGKSSNDAEAVKNLYKAEDIALPEGIGYVAKTALINDSFYIFATNYENIGEGEYATYKNTGTLYTLDSTGKLTDTVTIFETSSDASGMGSGMSINNLDFDSEANMWCFMDEYTSTETEYKSVTYLKKYDKTGKELFSKDLSEFTKDDENSYFSNFVIGADNNIYACANNSIWVMDSQGNLLFKTEKLEGDNVYIQSMVRSSDGKVYIMVQDYSNNTAKTLLKQIDTAAKGYGTEYDISTNSFGSLYNGSNEYDIYADKNGMLFGYDFETAKETEIINWTTCGINSDETQSMSILSDGRIVVSQNDYSKPNGETSLSILKKLDPSEVKDKKVLTLYCWGMDGSIKSNLVEFNKTSDEYIVAITDYSQFNDYTSEDESGWMAGAVKLNNDLIAGKIPDMLVLNGFELSVENYASKGLLADLGKMLDEDTELKREDFVENVLKQSEVDGKLYSIIPYFGVMSLYGKKSIVGDEPGWTFDDLYATYDKLPEGAKIMNDMTKSNTLQMFTYMNLSNYINWETGECKFNSDDYVQLLEFANKFETEINYDNVDWNEQQSAMSKDLCMLEGAYLYDYKTIAEAQATAGAEITYIGYPNSGGTNGACISGNSELSITSKSKNKEAAWKVIKYLLPKLEPEDEQNNMYGYGGYGYYGFPIMKDCLEQKAKKAMEPEYYIDENGNKQLANNTYNINGVDIKQEPLTQAEIDKINSLIDNAEVVVRYDESINKIIEEESATFFSGQKTAKEAAEMIQNRVTIYVNESK